MLTPSKHTSVKYSVLYISGIIFFEIKRSGVVKYDELKALTIDLVGRELGDSFEYSLSYLFLINKIDYNQSLDTFFLVQS